MNSKSCIRKLLSKNKCGIQGIYTQGILMKKQTVQCLVVTIYKNILILAVLTIAVLGAIYFFDTPSLNKLGNGYVFSNN